MPRPLFGYKIDPVTKKPKVHPPHAKIVASILAAEYGKRSRCGGSPNLNTRDSRRRIIWSHREWYLTGRARADFKADAKLAIRPDDKRYLDPQPSDATLQA